MIEQSERAAIYLDSNIFIYFVEGVPDLSAMVKPLFDMLKERPGLGVTSEIPLAEVLAPTKRKTTMDPQVTARLYLELMALGGFLGLEPVTRDVLLETPAVRKGRSLKLVDAIHLTTADCARCRYFVSRDVDFARLPSGMTRVAPNASDLAELLTEVRQ